MSLLTRMCCASAREVSRLSLASIASSRLTIRPGCLMLAVQPDRGMKKVHIEWKRPEKILSIHPRNSGDLEPLPKANPDTVYADFQDFKLEEMSPEQRKLYTLNYLPEKYEYKTVMESVLAGVQRHKLDYDSMEAQIARDTVKIRRLQQLYLRFPQNKRQNVNLKEIIERRKRRLNKLREADYKRFEWVLEKLAIEYRPKPEDNNRITRKGSIRKLTQEYCDQVKEEKITELKRKLQVERQKFEEEKKELLKWIEKEEELCAKLKEANLN